MKKPTPHYWLDLFTAETWEEFKAAGATVSGFREGRWKTVQKMQVGDFLLCYLTGISRWVGVLEVVSAPYQDTRPIWKADAFPCRVKVRPVVMLEPEFGKPVLEMKGQLSIFQDLSSPNSWTGHFRGSPNEFERADGEAIVAALKDAKANPERRPIDPRKLGKRPKAVDSAIGAVTIPEPEPKVSAAPGQKPAQASNAAESTTAEESAHTEMQWMLLKLGSDLGLNVWVARNDKGRSYKGQKFAALPNLCAELPRQFDEATNRTIELIDVLWLNGNAFEAAFEIESTTSIYSGLLRMADLISMQPNLKIPLYLVAPDERREKVFTEVNRPTFARMKKPLVEVCRYISFSALRERVEAIAPMVRYLKPEFVEEIAEACEIGD